MPPLGPNFTAVRVGKDDNGTPAMFVDGVSTDGRKDMTIEISWGFAADVAARSESSQRQLTSDFDPAKGEAWTLRVTGIELPEVGAFVVLTGRATMADGSPPPPVIVWSQTFDVEAA